MGLDWCLKDKPKPGKEESHKAIQAVLRQLDDEVEVTDEMKADFLTAYDAVRDLLKYLAISPYDTLNVPRIGIDENATEHFVKKIIPSHRKAIREMKKRPKDQHNQSYIDYWSRPRRVLLKEAHGHHAPDLAEFDCGDIQAYGPFLAMAGMFSFRGKAVGYSPLLTDDQKNEAYEDMDPDHMLSYAERIEHTAIAKFRENVGDINLPENIAELTPHDLLQLAEDVHKRNEEALDIAFKQMAARAKTDQEKGNLAMNREFMPDKIQEPTEHEEQWLFLRIVLQGARWMRFWAEKGHGMHAWY